MSNAELLEDSPPRCLSSFVVGPRLVIEDEVSHSVITRYRIACKCGEKLAEIVGYPLGSLNLAYTGPETFVGPIEYACLGCKKVAEVIDTKLHGYHGELGGSATYRGEGQGQPFPCSQCGRNRFLPEMTFRYWAGSFDLKEDEPEIAMQDYFNDFEATGRCADCGCLCLIAAFEC